ncbi:MAG: formate--tetrahydrofolate ligase [Proteobacteria bacterium]|nr:formate--tetrahydrofolate ligase [Pseudomonadota bacterium]MDA0941540.1 formate--tetrahydrofolate ligase [Pseudomonadota bacterium]MDA1034944.1 formate--tetrahydrofolate ligase [Pseudomonadota bacterium]
MKSDLNISQEKKLKNISNIANKIGLKQSDLFLYGEHIAKINRIPKRIKNAKLILVTAMSPTPAGEGKTTTTVGLSDALQQIGKKTIACLREPSLGPVFGMKGGATGGGYSQALPMEEINLHFTGDFHAITSANNLLVAMIDNHIFHGNKLSIDLKKIQVRRCLDMNDRSLRNISQDCIRYTRKSKFDISVASEVMAIFCLAKDLNDLEKRLSEILIAFDQKGKPIYAKQIKAHGAMTALIKDAYKPNLVQSFYETPILIHGGPFANIAHGCNSVVATQMGLKLADYVVTEAGFGADLGAEKFMDITSRALGVKPDAAVIVATIRALKYHGGVEKKQLNRENIDALKKGFANLQRHIQNCQKEFGLKVAVAVNRFKFDTQDEINTLKNLIDQEDCQMYLCEHWEKGPIGAVDLAKGVVKLAQTPNKSYYAYNINDSIIKKIESIATKLYKAKKVRFSVIAKRKLKEFERLPKVKKMPVCIAKTQFSFSSDPSQLGAALNHTLEVKDIDLKNGAGFVVVICGPVMTMPGLPLKPAAEIIKLNSNGDLEGLF